jgi:hypothetical protein
MASQPVLDFLTHSTFRDLLSGPFPENGFHQTLASLAGDKLNMEQYDGQLGKVT